MSNPDPNSAPSTTAQPSAAQPSAPHKPADDTEEVYYEGSPLLRGALGRGFLWIFAGIVLVAAAIAGAILHWHLPWWANVAMVVVALIVWSIPVIQTKTVRYRVSNYRIDYERGVFSKDIDTLELWHVEDVRFHQSLIARLLGVGTITVVSHDETTPLLIMRDIPQPRPLFEQLKQRIISVKRQRGVIKMDPG